MNDIVLTPAAELAARSPARQPGESDAYRKARQELLAAEIEVKRHIEQVAAMRRALPPGAPVTKTYSLIGENGPVTLEQLFEGHESLLVYSYMFGPQRQAPCPMCTSMMASFATKIADFKQRIGLAFVARSPIERLVEWKQKRGWPDLPVFSDMDGDYTREWVSADDADMPAYNVFTRRDGTIRHFWSEEMSEGDPGQDPRGAVETDPLWLVLDTTPEGRGDWYPELHYDKT